MSSLFGTMSVALQSMLAQQSALEVVANNIANTNTPGYSREVANFEEDPPVLNGNTMVGTGVTMASVESVRDSILNLRIDQETSQQSSLRQFEKMAFVGVESFTSAWQEIFGDLPTAEKEVWLDLVEDTCQTPEGIGQSDHFLYVGRKREWQP